MVDLEELHERRGFVLTIRDDVVLNETVLVVVVVVVVVGIGRSDPEEDDTASGNRAIQERCPIALPFPKKNSQKLSIVLPLSFSSFRVKHFVVTARAFLQR